MISKEKKVSALGLCSGGLDSRLAALVLRRQGIDVQWVTFETPFFSSAKARQAARLLNIPIWVKKIFPEYIEMLKNPPCGYGQHMNPCMDCHALMFRLAGGMMEEKGFDFLFSGEVLGQRPMSQTRPSLRYVEKQAGFAGYILRPLSAKRLEETIPEKEGLVDREKLLDLSGRSRKAQIRLAEEWRVTEYPAPAGGCLLTDKGYSARLRDLFDHQDPCTENALHLLKYGRHLRLDQTAKIIVGRTKKDNERIIRFHDPAADTVIKTNRLPGPLVLIPGGGSQEQVRSAASICVGYSKAPEGIPAEAVVASPEGRRVISVAGTPPTQIRHLLI
jgi:tRNA U34 2-thiouridine synthase MnmA/TrmU